MLCGLYCDVGCGLDVMGFVVVIMYVVVCRGGGCVWLCLVGFGGVLGCVRWCLCFVWLVGGICVDACCWGSYLLLCFVFVTMCVVWLLCGLLRWVVWLLYVGSFVFGG